MGGLDIQSSPHFLQLLHEWPLSTVYKGTKFAGKEGMERKEREGPLESEREEQGRGGNKENKEINRRR